MVMKRVPVVRGRDRKTDSVPVFEHLADVLCDRRGGSYFSRNVNVLLVSRFSVSGSTM